jgi:hypothetical protein
MKPFTVMPLRAGTAELSDLGGDVKVIMDVKVNMEVTPG